MTSISGSEVGENGGGALTLSYSEYNYGGDSARDIPPIVITHCLLSNRKTWDVVASSLARRTGQIVYTLDLRNHGSSPQSPEGDIKDYLSDLELFLKVKGISKCHFIGHSLGGKIETNLAFKNPEMVLSLILVDFLPIPTPEFLMGYMNNVTYVLGDLLDDLNESGFNKMEDAIQYCQQEFVRSKIEPESFRRALLSSLILRKDGFGWAFNLNYLPKHFRNFMDSKTEGKRFTGATLVVSPKTSFFVTAEERAKVRGVLPNAQYEVLPNVTHHLHMDDPEAFVKKCLEFWYN